MIWYDTPILVSSPHVSLSFFPWPSWEPNKAPPPLQKSSSPDTTVMWLLAPLPGTETEASNSLETTTPMDSSWPLGISLRRVGPVRVALFLPYRSIPVPSRHYPSTGRGGGSCRIGTLFWPSLASLHHHHHLITSSRLPLRATPIGGDADAARTRPGEEASSSSPINRWDHFTIILYSFWGRHYQVCVVVILINAHRGDANSWY